jgi:hypothetical protein
MSNDVILVISSKGNIRHLTDYQDSTKKVKKNYNASAIKNPIFLKFSQLAILEKDTYWTDFFISSSRNKFPRNFSFQNHQLHYKVKNKSDIFDLNFSEDKKIEEFYVQLKDFISNKSGLISIRDNKTNNIQEDSLKEREPDTFSRINSLKLQMIFIRLFCKEKSLQYNLSETKKKALCNSIICALISKTIIPTNIEMSSGTISKIHGLNFQENDYLFLTP